jgi:dimethylhistidine N-methyltransferase
LPPEAAPQAGPARLAIVHRDGPQVLPLDSLAEAVRRGLTSDPKTLPWTFFYDEQGSRLFEQICRLPEYYLTRTEDAILRANADEMLAGWPTPPTLIELGSGSAAKTQRLIAAALRRYGRAHYVPIDVSPTFIEESAAALVRKFPALRVTGHVADYRAELTRVAGRVRGPKLFLFLGSSLGNYDAPEAAGLLRRVARASGPADRFLLGTDLDKDRATLEAAYDDARGVTAAFNRNLLARINRELGADFDAEQFAHRATYRPEGPRVEMHLVSRSDQSVRVPGAGLTVRLAAGEMVHTENSHKYTRESLEALARLTGFDEEAAWTDPAGLFRVQRWRPLA